MWKEYLSQSGGYVYMIAGCLSSFLLGLTRSTKKKFIGKVGEGLTCSLVSTGLISISNYYFPDAPQLAVFIGVFCGFLGSDYLNGLFKSLINLGLERLESKVKSDSEKK